jgi:hypothetical protein
LKTYSENRRRDLMKAFDIIYAKFMPKNEEACNPLLLKQVGRVMRWQASSPIYWGPQEGQWSFYAKDDLELQPFIVSEEDLEIVEGPEKN